MLRNGHAVRNTSEDDLGMIMLGVPVHTDAIFAIMGWESVNESAAEVVSDNLLQRERHLLARVARVPYTRGKRTGS